MDAVALSFFLRGAVLGLSAAASPGPLQTLLISETLLGGFRRGARVALAPLVTDAPILAVVLVLLRRMPPLVVQMLGIAGGLFVLYLACGMWRQWRTTADGDVTAEPLYDAGWKGLRRAVLLNWVNPNPYAFWLLVSGPILLAALARSMVDAAAFVIGFYGVLVGGMLAVALVFDHARRLGPRVVRALLLASVVMLAAFGVLLLRQGWNVTV